jgi:hypothetical protein
LDGLVSAHCPYWEANMWNLERRIVNYIGEELFIFNEKFR